MEKFVSREGKYCGDDQEIIAFVIQWGHALAPHKNDLAAIQTLKLKVLEGPFQAT